MLIEIINNFSTLINQPIKTDAQTYFSIAQNCPVDILRNLNK